MHTYQTIQAYIQITFSSWYFNCHYSETRLHICSYLFCDLGPGQTRANASELVTLHQSALVNFELVQIMGVFPHNQPTKEISAIQGGEAV